MSSQLLELKYDDSANSTPQSLIQLFLQKHPKVFISEQQRQTLLTFLTSNPELANRLYSLWENRIGRLDQAFGFNEPAIYALFGCLPYTDAAIARLDEKTIFSMICFAAFSGHFSLIEELHKKKSLNLKSPVLSEIKATPLHQAAHGGHLAIIEALVKPPYSLGANPEDSFGRRKLWRSLLFCAALGGQLALIKALVKRPYNVGIKTKSKTGRGVLSLAASGGHLAVIEALVKSPYNLPIQDKDNAGRGLLHWAVFDGHLAVIEALVRSPYNLDIQDKDNAGCSVLYSAVSGGNLAIIKALVKPYHNLNSQNLDNARPNCSVLHSAVSGGNLAIIEVLVKASDNLDRTVLSLLYYAASNKKFHVIRWLVQQYGLTKITQICPLDALAREINNAPVFASLKQQMIEDDKERSARIDEQQQQIRRLIIQDKPTALAALLDKNPDLLEIKYEYGQTPLMLAVLSHRPACQAVLEKLGANVQAKAKNGKTVDAIAKSLPEEKDSSLASSEEIVELSRSLKLTTPLSVELVKALGRDEHIDLVMTVSALNTLIAQEDPEKITSGLQTFFQSRSEVLADDNLDYCFTDTVANRICLEVAQRYFPGQNPWNVVYAAVLHTGRNWFDAINATAELPQKPGEFFRTADGRIELYRSIIDTAFARINAGEFRSREIWQSSDSDKPRPLNQTDLKVVGQRSKTAKELITRCQEIEALNNDKKPCVYYFDLLKQGLKEGSIEGSGKELDAGEQAYPANAEFAEWWNRLGLKLRLRISRLSPNFDKVLSSIIDPSNSAARSGTRYCAQINQRLLTEALQDNHVMMGLQAIDAELNSSGKKMTAESLEKMHHAIEQELTTRTEMSQPSVFLSLAEHSRFTNLLQERGLLTYQRLHEHRAAIAWVDEYEKLQQTSLISTVPESSYDGCIKRICSMQHIALLECLLAYMEHTPRHFLCLFIKAQLAVLKEDADFFVGLDKTSSETLLLRALQFQHFVLVKKLRGDAIPQDFEAALARAPRDWGLIEKFIDAYFSLLKPERLSQILKLAISDKASLSLLEKLISQSEVVTLEHLRLALESDNNLAVDCFMKSSRPLFTAAELQTLDIVAYATQNKWSAVTGFITHQQKRLEHATKQQLYQQALHTTNPEAMAGFKALIADEKMTVSEEDLRDAGEQKHWRKIELILKKANTNQQRFNPTYLANMASNAVYAEETGVLEMLFAQGVAIQALEQDFSWSVATVTRKENTAKQIPLMQFAWDRSNLKLLQLFIKQGAQFDPDLLLAAETDGQWRFVVAHVQENQCSEIDKILLRAINELQFRAALHLVDVTPTNKITQQHLDAADVINSQDLLRELYYKNPKLSLHSLFAKRIEKNDWGFIEICLDTFQELPNEIVQDLFVAAIAANQVICMQKLKQTFGCLITEEHFKLAFEAQDLRPLKNLLAWDKSGKYAVRQDILLNAASAGKWSHLDCYRQQRPSAFDEQTQVLLVREAARQNKPDYLNFTEIGPTPLWQRAYQNVSAEEKAETSLYQTLCQDLQRHSLAAPMVDLLTTNPTLSATEALIAAPRTAQDFTYNHDILQHIAKERFAPDIILTLCRRAIEEKRGDELFSMLNRFTPALNEQDLNNIVINITHAECINYILPRYPNVNLSDATCRSLVDANRGETLATLMMRGVEINMQMFLSESTQIKWDSLINFVQHLSTEHADNIFSAINRIFAALEATSSFTWWDRWCESANAFTNSHDERATNPKLVKVLKFARDNQSFLITKSVLSVLTLIPSLVHCENLNDLNQPLKVELFSRIYQTAKSSAFFRRPSLKSSNWPEITNHARQDSRSDTSKIFSKLGFF